MVNPIRCLGIGVDHEARYFAVEPQLDLTPEGIRSTVEHGRTYSWKRPGRSPLPGGSERTYASGGVPPRGLIGPGGGGRLEAVRGSIHRPGL